jgi:hypothetical protein
MTQIFEDVFGFDFEDTFFSMDWDTAGARYISDGSGSQNYRGNFSDMMNGSVVNSIKWFSVPSTNATITANAGKSVKLAGTGSSSNNVGFIKTKRIMGSINQNGVMKFVLNVLGSTKGGTGILINSVTGTSLRMGLYRDENNYVMIVNDGATENELKIVTKEAGTATTSTSFAIDAEAAADILIELVIEDGLAQVLVNNIWKAENTTNIPTSSDFRGFVEITDKGAVDNFIDIDYIKIEI